MEKNNLELIEMPRITESNFKLNSIYGFPDLKNIEFELYIENGTEEINLNNHMCKSTYFRCKKILVFV